MRLQEKPSGVVWLGQTAPLYPPTADGVYRLLPAASTDRRDRNNAATSHPAKNDVTADRTAAATRRSAARIAMVIVANHPTANDGPENTAED